MSLFILLLVALIVTIVFSRTMLLERGRGVNAMRGNIALGVVLVVGGSLVAQIGGRALRWVAGTSVDILAAGLGELGMAVGAGTFLACLIALYRLDGNGHR